MRIIARLEAVTFGRHIPIMRIVDTWKALGRNETVRFGLFLLGSLFIAAAPIVGLLPGPGGIVCVAIGLSLALKNSAWAKRKYVAFKRRWPRYGSWTDWGLRRASARRRDALMKMARAAQPD